MSVQGAPHQSRPGEIFSRTSCSLIHFGRDVWVKNLGKEPKGKNVATLCGGRWFGKWRGNGEGGWGATLGRLNGKQPYFLHFNLSPLLISLVIALILDLSLKFNVNLKCLLFWLASQLLNQGIIYTLHNHRNWSRLDWLPGLFWKSVEVLVTKDWG